MANNETRVIKTDTFEGWRQKSNEVSFELGDVDQLDSRILDKNYTYTASAGDALFSGADTGSKTLRFEEAPEYVTDMLHVVIFTGSPTIPSNFVAGATCTQSGGFSGKLLWINTNKAAFSTVSGTFNAGQNLVQASQNIPHANLVRTLSESVAIGYTRVKQGGTEQTQTQVQAGFHVPNLAFTVILTGSPAVLATFSEGATVYQGSVGSETFTGTILKTTTSNVYLKTYTGTFSASVMLKQSETSGDRILASNITSGAVVDASYGTIVELHTLATGSQAILVIANDAVDAINEVQDDVGDITALGTTDKADVVTAVNELETGIRGSSASLIGAGLTTTANDLLAAVNEHDAELGTITAGALGTTASTVSTAIAEHETQIGNVAYGTTAQTLSGGINELDDELGTISAAAMGTTASTVGPAILELETEIDVLNARVEPTQAFAGTFTATTVMDALNEHETDIGSMSFPNSGTTIGGTSTSLTTALNALDTEIGDTDSYNDGTYGASTIAGTLDSLQAGMIANDTEIANRLKLNLDTTTQVLTGTNRQIDIGDGTDAVTLKFQDNAILDVSDGTTLFSEAGGVANFGSAFLNLDANLSTGMGLQVDRSHITEFSTLTDHDVRLQWNEAKAHNGSALLDPEEGWQVIGMETDGTTNTTSLVTRYNAFNLIANNTESGIAVTWDATNENFDFNVDDFDITLTGDVTGSGTVTNLADVSFATTIAANSVALGTDTTGNYIATIAGTANEITVSGSGSETSAVTISLPDDVTIGNNLIVTDYTRTAGLRVGTSGSDPGDNNLTVDGALAVGGNTTITGDLTVNGTQTTLSTATLEVEDTIILAGSDLGSTEPTSGGFGLETLVFAGVHSNAATGVTGAHSLVYNFGTDAWEADGSLVLSEATQGIPKVENTDFGSGKDLVFAAGSGLTEAVSGLGGNTFTVTYTNDDKGSSQNIFKTIAADVGGSTTANSNTDTLTIAGGNALTTNQSGDTITVNHDDTSSQASVNNSNGTVIQDITLDTYGHLTAIGSYNLDGRYYQESEFTSANTASKPVIRDGSGNFSAGTITANLTGTASEATNAGTLDGHDSTVFLRSNTADSFTGTLTMGTQNALVASDYGHGVHGIYNTGKYHHIWGRSTSDSMHASGTNLTGFYGLAWVDASKVNRAGGNQMFVVHNGTETVALGTNIWTSGTITGSGANITALSGSNISSGTVAAARIASLDTGKITTGTFADARIPNLSTAKLTSGTLPVARGGTGLTAVTTLLNSNTTASDVSLGNVTNESKATMFTSPTFTGTVSGVTKTHVGLSAVDNDSTATIRSGTTKANVGLSAVENTALSSWAGTTNITTLGTIATGTWQGTAINQAYLTGQSGTNTGDQTNISGLAGNATAVMVVANNTYDGNRSIPHCGTSGSQVINTNSGVYMHPNNNIVYATDFIASSDERLKDVIEPISGALDKVCSLDGFIYRWNDKASSGDTVTRQVGVSAQDVQEVLPEAVFETEGGYLGVAYDKLIPLLVESIKELKSEVEELKSINSKDKG